MRKYSTITFILAIAAFAFLTSSIKSYRVYEAESLLKELLQKMIYVEGVESVFCGSNYVSKFQASDTTLLYDMSVKGTKRYSVSSFYLDATEITTYDWWEFHNYKVHEVGREKADSLYYPDSLQFIREFPGSYNEPMTRNYFWHPKYDNYPVLAVSWTQAKEYCNWKSNLVNEIAADLGIDLKLEFRLPNEAEWELAARRPQNKNKEKRIADRQLYPWIGPAFTTDGRFLANYGPVNDQNGITVKGYPSDGALYTSEVGYYPPNPKGFYDLAGNVSEWVDLAPGFNFNVQLENYLKSCYDYAEEYKDYDVTMWEDRAKHNKALFSGPNKGLIKGGSWADGLAYLQIGSRQIMDKDKSSCKVGFRVAVSDPGNKYKKYFPKKNWTPK